MASKLTTEERLNARVRSLIDHMDEMYDSISDGKNLDNSCGCSVLDKFSDEINKLFNDWINYLKSSKQILPKKDENWFYCNRNKYEKPYKRWVSDFFIGGINHGDDRFLKFKRMCSERLSMAFPPSKKDDYGLLTGDLITGDWSQLYTVTGARPNTRGYDFLIGTATREKLGLNNNLEEDEVAMSVGWCLAQLMTSFFKIESVKNNKVSHSGKPLMVRVDGFKVAHYLYCMLHEKEIASLIANGNANILTDKFFLSRDGVVSQRYQSDKKGKKRYVASYKNAILNNGVQEEVDNRAIVDGHIKEGFVSQRVRAVKGYNSVLNTRLQSVTTCYLNGFTSAFPKAYKIRTKEELSRRIEESLNMFINRGESPVVESSDVTQFDSTMNMTLRRMLQQAVADKLSSKARTLEQLLLSGAQIFPPSREEEKESKWIGDPNKWSIEDLDYSLFSGIGVVTRDGKSNGSWGSLVNYFKTLIELRKVSKDDFIGVESSVEKRNRIWNMSIQVIDHGPDAYMHLINFGDDQLRIYCNKEFQKTYHSIKGIFKDDTEPGTQLIGMVPTVIEEDGSSKSVRVKSTSNSITYVTNMLCPEKGILRNNKSFDALGLSLRREIYSDVPGYHRINEILNSTFRECFPEFNMDLTTLIDSVRYKEEKDASRRHSLSQLSEKEVEILTNSDVLYYKYTSESDIADVSQAVLDAVEGARYPKFCYSLELNEEINYRKVVDSNGLDIGRGLYIHDDVIGVVDNISFFKDMIIRESQ